MTKIIEFLIKCFCYVLISISGILLFITSIILCDFFYTDKAIESNNHIIK